ncbi:MAG: hypothetical protein ACE5KO_00955 [Candidatus Bathyarchaeia archaeon]
MRYTQQELLEMAKVGGWAKKGGLYFQDVLGTYETAEGKYALNMWMKAEGFSGGTRIVLAARIRQPYELSLTLPDLRAGETAKSFEVPITRHIMGQKLAVSFYLRVNFDPNHPDDGKVDYGFELEGKSIKRISDTKLGRL